MTSLFDHRPGPALALADILAVEDTSDILTVRCPDTDVPVWPMVRLAFLRMMMGDLLYSDGTVGFPVSRAPRRAAAALARATIGNAMLGWRGLDKAPILANTEAVGDRLVDGRWMNRYVDHFIDVAGPTVALIDFDDWAWRQPRHNPRVIWHAPWQTVMAAYGRLPASRRDRQAALALVDLVASRAHALLEWDIGTARRARFERVVLGKLATFGPRYHHYARLLRRTGARMLLGSSHSYGIHTPLLIAARDHGAACVEYQHGAISGGHDAYNYAPAMTASAAFRRTLPDHLLTYGAWWGEQIDSPVAKEAIGYPDRAPRNGHERRRDTGRVLILGDGVETELYRDAACRIADALRGTGLTVVFRPHPLERQRAQTIGWFDRSGVQIDRNADIYDALDGAHAVISEVSTGLFEAIGLVERVIMLDTAKARFAFPRHPFLSAASVEQAIDLVLAQKAPAPVSVNDIWAPDWRNAFRQFLYSKGFPS